MGEDLVHGLEKVTLFSCVRCMCLTTLHQPLHASEVTMSTKQLSLVVFTSSLVKYDRFIVKRYVGLSLIESSWSYPPPKRKL